MPNYCDFEITVHGTPEDAERFSGYLRDSVEQDPGNKRNEVFVPLDDDTFGYFDRDSDVAGIWLKKGKEIQRTKRGDMQIVGWCAWEVPTTWLEQVSNLMPGLSFTVKATIEHELYQTWEIEDGQATLKHEELIPIR
jgi:hypothetical protein